MPKGFDDIQEPLIRRPAITKLIAVIISIQLITTVIAIILASLAWHKSGQQGPPGTCNCTEIPVATIVPYGAPIAPPTGWLICDGSEVNRQTYALLYSAIGVTYGPGDYVATFNLPDLRGRVVVGAGQGYGLSPRVIGSNFGAETHTLSELEMPSHTHSVSDPGHYHNIGNDNVIGQTFGVTYPALPGPAYCVGATVVGGSNINQPTHGNITGITNNPAGNSHAHDINQPSLVLNYIIKF